MRLFMFDIFNVLNYLIFCIRDFKKILMTLLLSTYVYVYVNLDKLLYKIVGHVDLNELLLTKDGSKQLSDYTCLYMCRYDNMI